MSMLDTLNPPQRQAVTTTAGPVLVLAGPGSGKTRVLTHRIAYLIDELGVEPWRIMAVTFTNKAADVMRARTEALLGHYDGLRGLTIGTFHRICARMLRVQAEHIGINPRYVIFDSDDQIQVIKQALRDLDIDEKRYRPRPVHSAISRAKNELILPADYPTSTYFDEIVQRVYTRYQELLNLSNGLDFDDLLMKTVLMLRDTPDIRTQYQHRYEYILVDEFQDTNTAQYTLVKLLSGGYRNVFVVGDEDQCIIPGSLIHTPSGPRPVETLQANDVITAAAGHGATANVTIDAVPSHFYKGPVVVVETKAGHRFVATTEHSVFARFPTRSNYQHVYLMYSHKLGYRIGRTGSTRSNGKKEYPGFKERLRQERADAIWLLQACKDAGETAYWESYYSAKYGLPTVCFYAKGRTLAMTEAHINKLFANLDTANAAEQLAQDLGLSLAHPHHEPQATIRGDSLRRHITFTMFGSTRVKTGGNRWHQGNDPWHLHELSICSSDDYFRERVATVLPTKSHKQHYWVARRSHGDYDKMQDTLESLATAIPEARIQMRSKMTDKLFDFMPVGHLLPGAQVPVLTDAGSIIADEVVSVQRESYEGLVYDISAPLLRNYIANGLVVHNSIYRFRGADYRNVDRFRKDFTDATVILLEQNYRSTQTILDAANAVISRNRHRTPKKLFTDTGQGEPIVIHQAYDEHEEGDFILDEIVRLQQRGVVNPGDCAIMYRTNAQSRSIEEAFIHRGMPYRLVGATRFYHRREVKDILAYMRLVQNPDDDVSMQRIINVPPRRIGAATVRKLSRWAASQQISMYRALCILGGAATSSPTTHPFSKRALGALLNFYARLQDWIEVRSSISPAQLLDRILDESGYPAWLRDGSEENEDRWANILELRTVSTGYDEMSLDIALDTFLEEVSLVSDVDNYEAGADAPTLLTLHAAKGLEFGVAFIVGCEDGLLPHANSFEDPESMEEERRLAYVGMTRAQKSLYLLHTFRRSTWGRSDISTPSRFLRDIPKRLSLGGTRTSSAAQRMSTWKSDFTSSPTASQRSQPSSRPTPASGFGQTQQYTPGQRVRHAKFGEGTVIGSRLTGDDEEVTVAFADKGVKRLLASYARLKTL